MSFVTFLVMVLVIFVFIRWNNKRADRIIARKTMLARFRENLAKHDPDCAMRKPPNTRPCDCSLSHPGATR